MNEAELEVAAFVTIHWNSCPPPFSLPSPSLMLSRLGLWNVVLGNNSIALIISLHNRGKPPLSEHSPIVEGWCNLMWHENSSSIFLRTDFLETALFHPADASGLHCFTPSLPAFSPSDSRPCPFSRHTPQARLKDVCMCVYTCMCVQVHVSGEGGGETQSEM